MTPLSPARDRTLALWHESIANRDFTDLPKILHPDARFRSPMAFKPYESAAAVHLILSTVITIFEDFTYHRQFTSTDGESVVLEFSAVVDGRSLTGVDIIHLDDDGLIDDFEVMIRPLNGLQALGARMSERLASHLAAYRA